VLPARLRLLSQAGHWVYAPTMTGLAERSHLALQQVDLNLHVQDIAAVLHYEDLHDVILTGHSYGGMVITGVAGASPDRIGKLVYLDAANPKNGQSLVDVAGPMMEMRGPPAGQSTASSWSCSLARGRPVLRRRRPRRPRRPRLDGRQADTPPLAVL
jgi:pimeloyl-ACP methyl ester carboxylesterase